MNYHLQEKVIHCYTWCLGRDVEEKKERESFYTIIWKNFEDEADFMESMRKGECLE